MLEMKIHLSSRHTVLIPVNPSTLGIGFNVHAGQFHHTCFIGYTMFHLLHIHKDLNTETVWYKYDNEWELSNDVILAWKGRARGGLWKRHREREADRQTLFSSWNVYMAKTFLFTFMNVSFFIIFEMILQKKERGVGIIKINYNIKILMHLIYIVI